MLQSGFDNCFPKYVSVCEKIQIVRLVYRSVNLLTRYYTWFQFHMDNGCKHSDMATLSITRFHRS